MRFDIAIIGGGVAGNRAAWGLAKKGYKVVVLEKKKKAGGKVCGGLVSERVIKLSGTGAVVNKIKGAYVIFPDGREICIGGDKTHAYVVDRDRFDEEMVEKAMEEGAEYIFDSVPKKIKKNRIEGREEIQFEYLIGADGARSFVASHYKMGTVEYINALQGVTKNEWDDDFVRVYIDKNLTPDFFAWIIPYGDKVKVGMGSRSKDIRRRFNEFVKKIGCEVKEVKGGVIPVGMRKLYKNNIILLGDAAGHVKATSGGGIFASMVAADTLSKNFPDLHEWKEEFMDKFGNEIKKTILARKMFLRIDNKTICRIAEYIENDIELINKYGDIDYQARVAKEFIKRHPRVLFYILKSIFGKC